VAGAQNVDPLAPQGNEEVIVGWLQQNAIPIRHVEAGNGFADLQPLKQILKDVKIVGLGEATHGTREFFQIKHRLLEFLVTELDFNAFALEASYAACQPINDYILYGKGDRATALTGQGYVVWDTEEFADMVDWLRAYNEGMPDEKKIRFYGLDQSNNENGRKEVLSYLRRVSPERAAATDSLFRVLAREEAKWPMRMDSVTENSLLQVLPQLRDLINHLTKNRDHLVSSSSAAEYNHALQYARVMRQWLLANTAALQPPFVDLRSAYMAENLMYLVDQAGSDAKFVVWQHNYHISREGPPAAINLGYALRRKYGDGYYALSLEFNQGSFQTRTLLTGNLLGDLKAVTLPPGPVGSLPWYLSRANVGNLMLNLRTPVDEPVVEQWLHAPQQVYYSNWVYSERAEDYLGEMNARRQFDGIMFIDTTTATRPTPNALKTVSRREGL
jgi:erythromycin esterase